MKKLLLTLTLALFGLNAMMAQSSLVATLSHEGNVSLFYGYNAFVDAMAAADHGDVITLSSGLFAPTTITKAVTIRGAAMYDDNEKEILKTEISNGLTISIPNETNGKSLTIEYLCTGHISNYCSPLASPKFNHIRFSTFTIDGDYSSSRMTDGLFTNVEGNISNYNHSSSNLSSFTVVNSYLTSLSYKDHVCQCNVINSIVKFTNMSSNTNYISFKNCIFPNPVGVLNSTNSCDHCLAIVEDSNADILTNMIGTNWTVNSSSEIFTGEDNYVLTPTAAQTYLGTDGTQVGIWGGPMPWTTTADNPSITKCQVAPRSTADGKLSVEIEVSGVQ